MKFQSNGGKRLEPCSNPQVGDVFASKGTGPKSYRAGTRYWLIIAITESPRSSWSTNVYYTHHMLGLDEEGNVVSTTTYSDHVMKERPKIGHCPNIASLELTIDWEPHA